MAIENEQHKRPKRKRKRTRTSKHSQSSVPSDLIVDILLRLPVKSLLRCMSVCKSWLSLISDSHFVKTHLNLSSATNNHYTCHHRLIYHHPYNNLMSCSLYDVLHGNYPVNELPLDHPFTNNHYTRHHVEIVGSCNGLLCLQIDKNDLLIWNPSTKKSHRLPQSGFEVPFYNRERYGVGLVYGFGYDESTDDYKVVAIFYHRGYIYKPDTMVKIYLLKSGNWKEIGAFPHGYPPRDSGKFFNGSLHWAAGRHIGTWKIVSIDLAKETFGQVLLPVLNKGDNLHKTWEVVALGEWLCVVCSRPLSCDVWVMKVYGVRDSWTKLYSIPRGDNPRTNQSPPLFMTNDRKVLFQCRDRFRLYDTKNTSFSEIMDFKKHITEFTFVESLVSPTGN